MTDMLGTAPSESLLTDILLRIYVAGAAIFFAAGAFTSWQSDPGRITLLMITVIETITAGIVVCSRRAQWCDWRPLTMVASFIATVYILALNFAPGQHVIPETFGVGLQIVGLLLFQLYTKLSLGRSVGVLPATRRLVAGGAYCWLRHPIYFGCLIAHLAFLLSNFSLQNTVVLLALYVAQVVMIAREEEMMTGLSGYREYRSHVHYPLIPFVF